LSVVATTLTAAPVRPLGDAQGAGSLPVLSVRGLSKSFGPIAALKPLAFDLDAGEIRAICGENGAGKSTFVNLLTGVYRSDGGTMSVAGEPCSLTSPRDAQRLGIALVAQELSVCPDLSVLDNIWLGSVEVPFFHRKAELRRRARAALAHLGADHIELDQPVSSLSIAERQLVEIARVMTRDARIVILDEPTATLSDSEIERIFAALLALKQQGRSVIYITHRLAEVFEICDSVTVLRNGELIATDRIANVDRKSLIEMMLGRSFVEVYPETQGATGAAALIVDRLDIPGRVRDFSVTVGRGETVCLAGQIGSGADSVVKAIAGLVYDATGSVTVGGRRLKMGSSTDALSSDIMFVSGDRAEEGIFRDLSVRDNLVATRLETYTSLGLLNVGALRREARRISTMLGVGATRLRSRASELSGGNQQKLAFGRCIDRRGPGATTPGIIVMIEPTRGVDVGARAEIYRLMREFCGRGWGLLVASTDLEEVIGLADSVVTMYRGRPVGRYRRAAVTMQQIVADITHPTS
jgi:ABC-type sugar transport system ATPase subunit